MDLGYFEPYATRKTTDLKKVPPTCRASVSHCLSAHEGATHFHGTGRMSTASLEAVWEKEVTRGHAPGIQPDLPLSRHLRSTTLRGLRTHSPRWEVPTPTGSARTEIYDVGINDEGACSGGGKPLPYTTIPGHPTG